MYLKIRDLRLTLGFADSLQVHTKYHIKIGKKKQRREEKKGEFKTVFLLIIAE